MSMFSEYPVMNPCRIYPCIMTSIPKIGSTETMTIIKWLLNINKWMQKCGSSLNVPCIKIIHTVVATSVCCIGRPYFLLFLDTSSFWDRKRIQGGFLNRQKCLGFGFCFQQLPFILWVSICPMLPSPLWNDSYHVCNSREETKVVSEQY